VLDARVLEVDYVRETTLVEVRYTTAKEEVHGAAVALA
jgi:hypothetical protein